MHELEGFDILSCPLIRWRGDMTTCVWCAGPKRPTRVDTSYWCSTWCRAQFLQNHSYTTARRECMRRNGPKCTACDQVLDLTCNHKMPILGQRSGLNCLNHQDNLEMVCWPCHELATADQIRRGLLPKR